MHVRAKAVAALCGLIAVLFVGVLSAGAAPATRSAVDCTGATPAASVIPSLTSASQGQSITVSGTCFSASTQVQVTFTDGPLSVAVGTADTDAAGTFTAPLDFRIPANAATGTGVGVFSGADSVKTSNPAGIDIIGCKSDSPVLTATPTSSPVGGTVDVAGACFHAGDAMTLTLLGGDGSTAAPALTTTPAAVTADANGAFTASFAVPFDTATGAAGKLTATDQNDGTANAPLAITACTPAITLSPTTAEGGTPVTVTGSCFTPAKTVALTFEDSANTSTPVTPTPTPPTVDAFGNFTASITVPAHAALGAAVVTAADDNAPPVTAQNTLLVTPAGTTTTTTPAGCPTTTTSSSTTTSSTTTTTTVAASSSTTTSVVYSATMTATPSTVAAGGTLTVTGTGFTPCAPVALNLHSDPVALATVTADATGAFSSPVTIPADTTPGSHTITGTSGTVNGIVSITVTAPGATSSSAGGSSSSSAAVTPAQSGGPLAFTGAHAALYGGLGLMLVLAGGAVAYLARRRRLENGRWQEL